MKLDDNLMAAITSAIGAYIQMEQQSTFSNKPTKNVAEIKAEIFPPEKNPAKTPGV